MVVIGGGATGVGIAVDAASRGYDVLLLEQHDFGKGTSSRSTKLVHGGVRYLEQGNISLVMEALKERGLLRQNAPHLVSDLAFVVPNYDWWEAPFYGIGLKVYNLLAGKYGFGDSRDPLPRGDARAPAHHQDRGPARRRRVLRRPVRRRAAAHQPGADRGRAGRDAAQLRAGHRRSRKDADGFVDGVHRARPGERRELRVAARRWSSTPPGPSATACAGWPSPTRRRSSRPSQGVHLVFDGSFLPGDSAIMVPHTSDGRVMFAIPWHGHTLVGTTDTPDRRRRRSSRGPLDEEIEFILETARPLPATSRPRAPTCSACSPASGRSCARATPQNTAALSRDHTIHIDASGLLTITGGKWTTYRNMAEDTVNQAATLARLPDRDCPTRTLNVHGFHPGAEKFGALQFYGSDALLIQDLVRAEPALGEPLHRALPTIGAEVVFAARHEMARTVEDVLARRTRGLFLNAQAAAEMAPAGGGAAGARAGPRRGLAGRPGASVPRAGRGLSPGRGLPLNEPRSFPCESSAESSDRRPGCALLPARAVAANPGAAGPGPRGGQRTGAAADALDRELRRVVDDYVGLYRRESLPEWRKLFLPSFVAGSARAEGQIQLRTLDEFYEAQRKYLETGRAIKETLENVRLDRHGPPGQRVGRLRAGGRGRALAGPPGADPSGERGDYEGTSLDTLRQMVVMAIGVAFLPSLYIRSEIHRPRELRVTTVHGEVIERTHALVWRASSPARTLFGEIADELTAKAMRDFKEELRPVARRSRGRKAVVS